MNQLPNKPKFFKKDITPEEEDPERTFHFEMSSAYAAASSAAAQPKKRKGKFFGVNEEDTKGVGRKK